MPRVEHIALKVGLEIHVELSAGRKVFAPSAGAASVEFQDAPAPNTLIDPVVLGLPGALPVLNKAAVEMSVLVGLALGCQIARDARWDRKSYFYADMPKGYQISQYPMPVCGEGVLELPPITSDGKVDYAALLSTDQSPPTHIRIARAHLEEDAGKLLHEAPGGHAIEGSLVDLNRAGTALLEIVTHPDFTSASQVVAFAQMLRDICRFLGVTQGVMQKGHMRFEPNINCLLTLSDGRTVATPIVEVKNLNSFKSLRGAIDYELREQPARWERDQLEHAPGNKTTRGWDDTRAITYVQREKEDAQDYRYFPDPDLPAVRIDQTWLDRVRASLPELPVPRAARYMRDYSLSAKDAAALVDERAVSTFYELAIAAAAQLGMEPAKAGRQVANLLLQSGAKRANERSTPDRAVLVSQLGITPRQVGTIALMRDAGEINSGGADELFGVLCSSHAGSDCADPRELAKARGMLIVRDDDALIAWCRQSIAENPKSAEDVKAGKHAAIGRLVGAVMKLSGGAADAAAVREKLLLLLGAE